MARQFGTVEQVVRFLVALQLAAGGYVCRQISTAGSFILYGLAFLLLTSAVASRFRRRHPYEGPERRRRTSKSSRLRSFALRS